MKIDYILKKLQNTNHNIIETYSYLSHYKHMRTNDYLQKSIKTINNAKEIINSLIDEIKEMEKEEKNEI